MQFLYHLGGVLGVVYKKFCIYYQTIYISALQAIRIYIPDIPVKLGVLRNFTLYIPERKLFSGLFGEISADIM